MKCKLCEINDLDNTRVHYITESIARTAVSEEGKKGRDNELMYSFSISTLGKDFIGRNINEDKIKEIIGREMTEKDLQENQTISEQYEMNSSSSIQIIPE